MNRSSKVLLSLILVILISCKFCSKILAVSITINNFPSEINSLDNFQITASISGATNATNYLRVDLYKDGTSNYFGETYNGNDWYSGGEGKNYLSVQIQNSSASATLFAQLGNPTTTQYPGPGSYKLKIRRYTNSGNASSNDTQTPVDIQITYVIPTPTLDPTPNPTNFQSNTPVSTPPKTPSPSPTPVKTATPRPTPFPTSEPEVLGEASNSAMVADITNLRESLNPTPEALGDPPKNKFPVLAIVFVGTGIVLIGVSAFLIYKKQKENPDIIGK